MRYSDTADRSDGKLKAQIAPLREQTDYSQMPVRDNQVSDHEAGLIVRARAAADGWLALPKPALDPVAVQSGGDVRSL
jgi:hypothetical protein